MAANTAGDWALERELVLTRVIDAPRELVFEAWTKPEHVSNWFGPKGFVTTTLEMDFRVGGRWRFEMRGPDGTLYDNRIVYLEIDAPKRLVFDHGRDLDDDPSKFRVIVTFDQQNNGKTVLTMRQLHPTKEQRDAGMGFGAVELGQQTLDKLAEHLRGMQK